MSKKKASFKLWACVIAACGVFFVATERIHSLGIMNITKEGTKVTVLIDAGHGGADPGKVGVAGTHEKDVNLAISKELEKIMTKAGYRIEMTRRKDVLLGDGKPGAKKISDLRARVELIRQKKPAIVVSIHQNSYPGKASGAQVFYYKNSVEGACLAKYVQEALREQVAPENHRVEKANEDYYLLKNSTIPTIIVECGFLSDTLEERRLGESGYQKKVAEAIAEGVENFLYK